MPYSNQLKKHFILKAAAWPTQRQLGVRWSSKENGFGIEMLPKAMMGRP